MASRLNPYLTFNGNARQAMEFYRDVFGGDLTVSTFGEFGDPSAANADQVMHAMLETANGFSLMASDTAPGHRATSGDNVVISLSGDDADDLRGYWAKLSDAGTVTTPLEQQMWGDEYGSCTDQFGVAWLVDIAAPADAAG